MDAVRELIVKRIAETGLKMAQISRQLDRNPTYLQQFISRNTPVELEERDRVALAAILEVDPAKLQGPGRRRTMIIETKNKQRQSDEVSEVLKWFIASLPGSHDNVPYYYSTALPSGGFKIAPYPRFRPSRTLSTLLSTQSYFLLISNDDMAPKLERGSIAFVDPSIKPQPEMICVLRQAQTNDGGKAFVRRIREITEEYIRVYKATMGTESKRSMKHLQQTFEDFSKKEWRAELIVGALFTPVT